MSRGASRTFILENEQDSEGNVYHYREQAEQLLTDLLATLDTVGGMFAVTARRVEVPGGPEGVTLGQTVGVVVEWRLVSPLERLPKSPASADEPHRHEPAPDPADAWDGEDELLLSAEPDEASLEAEGLPA